MQNRSRESSRVVLRVDGMTCMHCVARVREALEQVSHASHVVVDLEAAQATLQYPDHADKSALIHAVSTNAGKKASLVLEHPLVSLRVDGMSCMGCVAAVKDALQNVPHTSHVDVDLENDTATLRYSGDVSLLIHAVKQHAGKTAIHQPDNQPPSASIQPSTPPRLSLRVDGMTCMSCVKRVTEALENVSDTSEVSVDLTSGLATLRYPGDVTTLVDAVKQHAGKIAVQQPQTSTASPAPSASTEITLRIDDMNSSMCVASVTNALQSVEGTREVQVNLHAKLATLLYQGQPETLIAAIARDSSKTAVLIPSHGLTISQPFSPTLSRHSSRPLSPISPPSNPYSPFSPRQKKVDPELTTTQLRVAGMTCSACVGGVENTLLALPSVISARVNLLAAQATIIHHPDVISPDKLCQAVISAGYRSQVLHSSAPSGAADVEQSEFQFCIHFPTDAYARSAVRALDALQSVVKTQLSFRVVTVTLAPGEYKATVLRALEAQGGFGKMTVTPVSNHRNVDLDLESAQGATNVIDEEAAMWRRRFFLSLVFFIPILISTILHSKFSLFSPRALEWVHFTLSTPIQFVCGSGFYRGSYYALRKGRATMDVLISLSSSIAYFSSVVVLILGFVTESSGGTGLGHSSMFRVSAMIITMVLIGKWLESSAKRRAAVGVASLSSLAPDTAILYDMVSCVACHTHVPVEALAVGDTVQLIPGDRVPTDGEVVKGVSSVDESMLTGESQPVPKGRGDFVYGGSVNGSGSMVVRTSAIGSDAVLSQIVKLVNDAQTARAPVEALADSISAIFVPVVVFLSLCVFLLWFLCATIGIIPEKWYAEEGKFFFSLLFALETMVIACPCALGLATPTAVMVACEVGTGMGVLFRGGAAAVEAASRVKTIVFDKTGTLTMGSPEVVAVVISEKAMQEGKQFENMLSELVTLVEGQSHHPLAGAICKYIKSSSSGDSSGGYYKLSELEEVAGMGMRAVVNDGEYKIRVGSAEFAFEGVSRDDLLSGRELSALSRMEREERLTLVSAVVNDEFAVMYGLKDNMRAEAADVVAELEDMNFETGMVTGDGAGNGIAVAEKAGIDLSRVHTGALPWKKVDYIESYQPACFVGDGLNDAPALAAASLGIAVGAGAPVAAESASVVLVRSDLWGVVDAIDLARATLRRVHLNFVWALGYNVACVPLAAGVLFPFWQVRVPPMVASGAMALSSTCVIISSLALRLYKQRGMGRRNLEARMKRQRPEDVTSAPLFGDDGLLSDRVKSPLLTSDDANV